MDDLAFLRGRIESYADYTIDDSRSLADEQVRAYVGEALSRLGERLRPADGPGDALARVLLRCQFADQLVIRALNSDDVSPGEIAQIHGIDRELVSLADRADAMASADVGSFITQIETAFDTRARIIKDSAAAEPQTPPR